MSHSHLLDVIFSFSFNFSLPHQTPLILGWSLPHHFLPSFSYFIRGGGLGYWILFQKKRGNWNQKVCPQQLVESGEQRIGKEKESQSTGWGAWEGTSGVESLKQPVPRSPVNISWLTHKHLWWSLITHNCKFQSSSDSRKQWKAMETSPEKSKWLLDRSSFISAFFMDFKYFKNNIFICTFILKIKVI